MNSVQERMGQAVSTVHFPAFVLVLVVVELVTAG